MPFYHLILFHRRKKHAKKYPTDNVFVFLLISSSWQDSISNRLDWLDYIAKNTNKLFFLPLLKWVVLRIRFEIKLVFYPFYLSVIFIFYLRIHLPYLYHIQHISISPSHQNQTIFHKNTRYEYYLTMIKNDTTWTLD